VKSELMGRRIGRAIPTEEIQQAGDEGTHVKPPPLSPKNGYPENQLVYKSTFNVHSVTF
jgi:hypothetical protein